MRFRGAGGDDESLQHPICLQCEDLSSRSGRRPRRAVHGHLALFWACARVTIATAVGDGRFHARPCVCRVSGPGSAGCLAQREISSSRPFPGLGHVHLRAERGAPVAGGGPTATAHHRKQGFSECAGFPGALGRRAGRRSSRRAVLPPPVNPGEEVLLG